MAGDLAKTVAGLIQAVRQGQGALLMDLDGVPVEQAASAAGPDLETIAGEYAGLLREARSIAAELGWGAPRRFGVRGASRQVVFAFAPGDLVLGVEAGGAGLRGQMGYAVTQALGQLGDL
jgi:predicted regulator of Ras-like GTPase activity (Roadblock/LC7/MglB family)